MKYFFFLLIAFTSKAQLLHHQSMASQGKSIVTAKGLGVSQTIGQPSVAGSASRSGYVVQQGFQQSLLSNSNRLATLTATDVVTKVFPNPFITTVSFEFGSEIKEEVEVILYDALGRVVYSSKIIPENNRLTLTALGSLSEGNYFASLSAKNFKYTTQIIKLNLQ